jgi:adenine deaminase
MDKKVIDVALGNAPADLIIEHGTLVNVNTGEIYPADLAISGDRIASIGSVQKGAYGPDTRVIDAAGLFLAPGFIDAHIHIESSMLTYTEFSKMVVKHGTTAVATDLMEVTIVSGIEGMKEILKEAETSPVKLYYTVPAFMEEESEFQTTGSQLDLKMMEELIQLPEAVGLAEVMAPPILAGSPLSEYMLNLAKTHHKTAEGHAPVLVGAPLNAYASAGIRSDHECTDKEEALARLRCGMRVHMREGSASTDLKACLKAVVEENLDTRHCTMVSDDIDALHISTCGHMDYKIRMAIAEGVSPMAAIQMATINPAESFRIDDQVGSIAPGKYADVVFLSSLEECKIEKVIAKGEEVAEGNRLLKDYARVKYAPVLFNTVKFKRPIDPESLLLKVDAARKKAKVHVIEISPTSLLTTAREAELDVKDGIIQPNLELDVLYISCVERYGKNGNIGKSFVKGFGMKEGAIAISVSHDHHNITVVGTNAEDMAAAVNRIHDLQGGLVLVGKGKVLEEIALPICGLLSPDDGEAVARKLANMISILNDLGCRVPSPNVTLSFIALIFIPDFGITDAGLFDVKQFN